MGVEIGKQAVGRRAERLAGSNPAPSTMQKDFTILLQQSKPVIYSIINKYCNDEQAQDDIFQEVSISAWENFHTFCGKSKFTTWIAAIARNKSVDRFRRLRSFAEILTDNFFWEIIDEPYAEDSRVIDPSVIQSLSKTEQNTLQLRMDGLSFEKISELTGEPISRLTVRMHRIKQRLSKQLKNKTDEE